MWKLKKNKFTDHRLFLIFFVGIYFRDWHHSKFFAGTYFRGWIKNPRKPRKLIPAKVNPIKVVRKHKGGGEGSSQMCTIAYKGEGGGLIFAIFVRTYYVDEPYSKIGVYLSIVSYFGRIVWKTLNCPFPLHTLLVLIIWTLAKPKGRGFLENFKNLIYYKIILAAPGMLWSLKLWKKQKQKNLACY